MLSLRGLFFYGFTSHVYYFRLEIYNKTIIEFSLWFSPLEMYNKTIIGLGSANNSYLDIDNFHITTNLVQ